MFTAKKNAPNNKDMGDMMAPVHTASSVFTDLELLEQCRQIFIGNWHGHHIGLIHTNS